MGLNLEIKRVVFEAVTKHDGMEYRDLTVPELKQIGGRAGRFRTARDDASPDASEGGSGANTGGDKLGLVTCMEAEDLPLIHRAFRTDAKPLDKCYVCPPGHIIEKFYAYFPPNTPLSYVLLRIQDIAQTSPRFEVSVKGDMLETADTIEEFELSLDDRLVLINAPTSPRDAGMKDVTKALARCIANMDGGHLLDIKEIDLEVLEIKLENFVGSKSEYLSRLEGLHKAIVLYLWVSYRFAGIFQSQNLAFHVRDLVQERINNCLGAVNVSAEKMAKRRLANRRLVQERQDKHNQILPGAEEETDMGAAVV